MPSPPAAARMRWLDLCRSLVDAAVEHATSNGALIAIPGEPSKHGERYDGLEGFSRAFLAFAFGAVAEPNSVMNIHADWFRAGIAAGVGADNHEAIWPAAESKGHSIVDAGTMALALRLLPADFLNPLPAAVTERLLNWLRDHAIVDTPENNWVVFRLSIASQLARMGRLDADVNALTADSRRRLDEWYDATTGWYSDGDSRTFDYYNAFEFHFVPPLLAYLDDDVTALEVYGERLELFLSSLSELIDAEGVPVYVGRSLTYRFAIAAPFALAALISRDEAKARQHGRRARLVVSAFVDRGALGDHGVLQRGWFAPRADLAQDYSGPGAAYFAGRAFLALLLPAEHPFWSEDALGQPLTPRRPRTLPRHPHWLIDPAVDGSVVRLINHGSTERVNTIMRRRFDEPLYSRVAYSSATAPAESHGHVDRGLILQVDGLPCARGIVVPNHSGDRWVSSWSHPRQLTSKAASGAPGAWRGKDLDDIFVHHLTAIVEGWQVDVCAVVGATSRVHELSLGGWSVADAASSVTRRRRASLVSHRLVTESVALHAPRGRMTRWRSTLPQPFGRDADFLALIVPTTAPWRRGPLRTDRTLWIVGAHRLDLAEAGASAKPPRMRGRLAPRVFSGITLGRGTEALRIVLDESGLRATA